MNFDNLFLSSANDSERKQQRPLRAGASPEIRSDAPADPAPAAPSSSPHIVCGGGGASSLLSCNVIAAATAAASGRASALWGPAGRTSALWGPAGRPSAVANSAVGAPKRRISRWPEASWSIASTPPFTPSTE